MFVKNAVQSLLLPKVAMERLVVVANRWSKKNSAVRHEYKKVIIKETAS